jgi:hypothetical protein
MDDNSKGLHTDVNEDDIFAKKEMPANNTHLYDGVHVTNQVVRGADLNMDVDTKYMTTFKQPEAYEAACMMDVTIKTDLQEVKDEPDRRGTEILADNTYLQAMIETCQKEDVNKTYPVINIENIRIMRIGTNKPPGTTTCGVKGLHTREKEED